MTVESLVSFAMDQKEFPVYYCFVILCGSPSAFLLRIGMGSLLAASEIIYIPTVLIIHTVFLSLSHFL